MQRKAQAIWKGTGAKGAGQLTAPSGVLRETPYSYRTRFENEDGRAGTNPEELIAAAHAGCFNMALSFILAEAGNEPETLDTTAKLTLQSVEGGFEITQIQLHLTGKVPGMSENEFHQAATMAKENCPVSKALSTVPIQLEVELER